MALSKMLGESNFTADEVNTNAKVTLEKIGESFEITNIDLTLDAKISKITEDKFKELANMAKENCPVSKLFKTNINLHTNLRS